MKVHEFSALGVAAKQKKAEARRSKVAELKAKGMSGPEIAEQLGEKLRTVYSDFAKLKNQEV